jgi:HSP20 family protein
MKLTNYHPFGLTRADLNDWFQHPLAGFPSLSRFFSMDSPLGRLAADVHEDKDNYYASFEVPGVKKEDVKVELNDRLLSVTVTKKDKSGEQESSFTSTRSISVPESVKADTISAKIEDGILTVTLPKGEDRKGRSIEIA